MVADNALLDLVNTMRSDYDAMSSSKYVRSRSGLAPSGGGADYHIRNETQYLNLIEKARDLCMNASIVGKSIEKAGTNVVGDGFTLCPDTGDTGVDTLLFDKWAEWTNNADACDVAGERTWSEMEELATISAIRDGDIIGLGTEDGGLQLIESHQCRNPKGGGRSKNVVVGVEMNELRKRERYHIRSEVINPYKSIGSAPSNAYDVRDAQGIRVLFHYFVSERSSSTRGVTALAPCFQKLAMFDDLDFAKLVQAQAVSCIAFQRIRNVTNTTLPTRVNPMGPEVKDENGVVITQQLPGAEVRNNPGERLEAFANDVPNTNYFEHAKMLLTMFFLNIGLPYVMGMMDASESNFSGWRAATDEAKKGFKRQQRQLRDKWHRPVYSWKLHQWIADDKEVKAAKSIVGDKLFNHLWRLPKWPYIQPTEDAMAQAFRVQNLLTSPRRLHGEMSQDWEEVVNELVEDNSLLIRKLIIATNAINAELKPEPLLTWPQLLNPTGLDATKLAIALKAIEPQRSSNATAA